MKDPMKQRVPFEEYMKYTKSLKSGLKLLTANEIVEKIKNGDKDFSNVRIFGVDWARRDLSKFNFSGSKLEWNVFSSCKLVNADFSNSFVDWCTFDYADLTRANFEKAIIWDSLFDNTNIKDADFSRTRLRYVLFTGTTNINVANFFAADKFNVYLSWDDISDANLNFPLKVLDTLRIPQSKLLALRAKVMALQTKAERFRVVYNIGREFVNPSGSLYDHFKTDVTPESFYLHERDKTVYGPKNVYGMKKGKGDKDVSYRK